MKSAQFLKFQHRVRQTVSYLVVASVDGFRECRCHSVDNISIAILEVSLAVYSKNKDAFILGCRAPRVAACPRAMLHRGKSRAGECSRRKT